ncbi:MAG: AbrB/MazE/SpoVT family DNA-binding domain-containing protein [Bdellovibrionaceae bacterium]|nr:AbrB/MazE/SpoVT family DNA-binding domain-containing protein [Pseudobdellovibrionaceae bacterium]NUM57944.1 AbrB/MazE/SpoVT family DNA-binding domain-containing protein [Pseudobdellovibrionaceae bacterium]
MSGKIQKWGNSLGVRIPKQVIEKLNLTENSEVEVSHKDGAIIIIPVKKKFSLENLLEQITKNNCYQEEDFKTHDSAGW